ncbi:TPA: hypothetical protein PMC50_002839 [Vibrio cholerae]|nr:hypothetical protein [Vibrio cholerae]
MVITQTEKYNIVADVFKSLNSIRAFMDSVESFSDLETMFHKFEKCFIEAKEKEDLRIEQEQAKLAQANDVLNILTGMGLTIEEFNKLMLRSGKVGAVTLSDASSNTVTPKAKKKEKTQPVYVFEYEENGKKVRTPLRGATGRKPAAMTEYMKGLGLNSYSPEDCMNLVVRPTQEEVNDFLRSGGNKDLIQHKSVSSDLESRIEEDGEDLDVDNPQEQFGNK